MATRMPSDGEAIYEGIPQILSNFSSEEGHDDRNNLYCMLVSLAPKDTKVLLVEG